jgi:hypothetical protein
MTSYFLRAPILLFSTTVALLLGCPGSVSVRVGERDEPVCVRLGQEFDLHVGQRAAVEGEGLQVRFASVVNDSRCPEGVTCVWAGNAEVLIETGASNTQEELKLNTLGGERFPKEARYRQYIVELVALKPHPQKDVAVKAADYVATLVIRKQ